MRPVYLGITGYLVSYLGQQRLELQEKMRQLEVAQQRHRIARDLHDGYAQALAGINLRLEASRRLLGKNAAAEALSDLTDLQESVNREYDELRRYARELAGVEFKPALDGEGAATQLRVRTDLAGPIELVEHVLDIAREGARNVRRHAQAKSARIEIEAEPSHVRIQIDDDGVGFDGQVHPWAIASTGQGGRRADRGRDRAPPGSASPDHHSERLSMQRPIRIIIADDHLLFRQGLKSLLESEPEVTIVGETDRAERLPELLDETRCDLLLLDLQMERNALADIEALVLRVPVIVLTASEVPSDAVTAIRKGARAVVFKRFAVETLMEAIRTVASDNVWLPATLQTHLPTR